MAETKKNASPPANEEPVIEEKEDPASERKSIIYVLSAIGLFIVIVVLIFVFSGSSQDTTDTPVEMYQEVLEKGETDFGYVYNGYVFIHYSGLWMTRITDHRSGKDFDVPFRWGPRDVEEVRIQGNHLAWIITTINQSQFYLTFDAEGEDFRYLALASSELSANMAQVADIRPIPACTTNTSTACQDIPVITCDSTDAQVIHIIDRPGEPVLTKRENCLILEGEGLELLKPVDRLFYTWYGIMGTDQISTTP